MVATVVRLAMKELHFKESFTSPMSNIFSTTKMPVKAVNFSQNGRFSAYLCAKEQENPWFRFPKFWRKQDYKLGKFPSWSTHAVLT